MFFDYQEYIKITPECQLVGLTDKKKSGKIQPWSAKKVRNLVLAFCYDRLGYEDRAKRAKMCASHLVFREFEDGTKKLHNANFCQLRLCPTCAWRRTKKIFAHTSRIMDAMEADKQYGYVMLTLTIPSVAGESLSKAMDDLMMGWNRLCKYKRFEGAVKGWYRGLEITHNTDRSSKSFDTYHPHFHCILAVNKTYFKNAEYVPHDEWLAMWQKAMRMPEITQVNVERIKGNTAKAVAETAKYTVKDTDYIVDGNEELTDEAVSVLDSAMAKRRLVAFGGRMKEYHKKLNLDDEVDGDLVNVGDDEITADELGYKLVTYVWGVGFNGTPNYWKVDEK